MSDKRFQCIWDAIEDTSAAAENLRLRSELMLALCTDIEQSGWTPAEAAWHLRVTQSRILDLKYGKIELFDLDTLVSMIATGGLKIEMQVSRTEAI